MNLANSLVAQRIAGELLRIKAVKLQPNDPFTWASGWKSPIYCDNRKTMKYPDLRKEIAKAFAQGVREKFPNCQVIHAVATGAIAIGVMVAEELNVPFGYVRPTSKGHGLGNRIEGEEAEGNKTVVIEDLISTGGSSLSAVKALRSEGADVLGMFAIFTYGFEAAEEKFAEASCDLYTLSHYSMLLNAAVEGAYVNEEQLEVLAEFCKSPSTWKPANS